MTKKQAHLKKIAFKEGVRAGAVKARKMCLEADYKALIRQWVWLTDEERWQVEVYAQILRKRGEATMVRKFEELYVL